jgi:hypothetical protein
LLAESISAGARWRKPILVTGNSLQRAGIGVDAFVPVFDASPPAAGGALISFVAREASLVVARVPRKTGSFVGE